MSTWIDAGSFYSVIRTVSKTRELPFCLPNMIAADLAWMVFFFRRVLDCDLLIRASACNPVPGNTPPTISRPHRRIALMFGIFQLPSYSFYMALLRVRQREYIMVAAGPLHRNG